MRKIFTIVAATALLAQPLASTATLQNRDAFEEMADTERAFAARAQVVGWKQAFLEYFADDAVGLAEDAGPAKEQIRRTPDPPPGVQLLWEPRFGDIAASGDLGWLTGPVTSINPARTPEERYSTYFSIWKRQPDGTFKVVIDIGAAAPGPVSFAPGLVRAGTSDRYAGQDTTQEATQALARADAAVNKTPAGGPGGLLDLLAADGRLHRNGAMPFIGRAAAETGANADGDMVRTSRFAEVAASRDLGYTWGTAGSGHYARVWTRTRAGAWRIALDIIQP